jgi:hypothetical protein
MQSHKRSDEVSLDYSKIIRRLDSLEEGSEMISLGKKEL